MEAFAGVVVGGIIALLAAWLTTYATLNRQTRLAREAQLETRRTQRHEYLIWLMHELVEARIAYEAWLGESSLFSLEDLKESQSAQRQHANTIGKAIAACLASGDTILRDIAENPQHGLTPYFVEGFKSRNRDKLHEALNRLGVLINSLTIQEHL
jgi:hypothetical protein